jgi:glucose/arabinose dehydrogenase
MIKSSWSDPSERAILVTNPGLNHAVRINGGYLYASNATHVLRWPYTAGDRSPLGEGAVVVKGIPCCHHVSRSLAFDQEGYLYVQVGSGSNVDPDSTHARVNQFNVTEVPEGGIEWTDGFVFSNGLRNEVGIRFDKDWKLWGVENGVDSAYRAGLLPIGTRIITHHLL